MEDFTVSTILDVNCVSIQLALVLMKETDLSVPDSKTEVVLLLRDWLKAMEL